MQTLLAVHCQIFARTELRLCCLYSGLTMCFAVGADTGVHCGSAAEAAGQDGEG